MGRNLFRSKVMEEKYKAHRVSGVMEKSCVLCDAPAITSFTYWKIIPNNFPYDLITETHHMIVPLRHVTENGLTAEERAEYLEIKNSQLGAYQFIMESTPQTKSIPAHLHFHLVTARADIA